MSSTQYLINLPKEYYSIKEYSLIPNFGLGDKVALVSYLLSSMRIIKEFRRLLLSDLRMSKSGQLFSYNVIEEQTAVTTAGEQ